ncbi:MAG: 4-alpha-glucanotransferase [Nocardioides sp.]
MRVSANQQFNHAAQRRRSASAELPAGDARAPRGRPLLGLTVGARGLIQARRAGARRVVAPSVARAHEHDGALRGHPEPPRRDERAARRGRSTSSSRSSSTCAALLNTRQGEAPDGARLRRRSTSPTSCTTSPRRSRCSSARIRATILQYEPRLKNVVVQHVRDEEALVLKFQITAQLAEQGRARGGGALRDAAPRRRPHQRALTSASAPLTLLHSTSPHERHHAVCKAPRRRRHRPSLLAPHEALVGHRRDRRPRPPSRGCIRDGGARLVQLLPLGEIAGGETSPYSALSAFGIDPDLHLALRRRRPPRVRARPRSSATTACARSRGSATHSRDRLRGRAVAQEARLRRRLRALPSSASTAAADHATRPSRASVEAHRAWLDDYALFRALKDAYELARVVGVARGRARPRPPTRSPKRARSYATGVLKHQYAPVARARAVGVGARADLRALGVEIMGDLPFMVGRDSADVWANRDEFRSDASVGVPRRSVRSGGPGVGPAARTTGA